MISYKTDVNNVVIQVNKSSKVGLQGYKQTEKEIFCEMIDNLNDTFTTPTIQKTEDELKVVYKGYYLAVWENKLKELQYDSIATVDFWAKRELSIYYTEANNLLNWYESIINKNIQIISDVKNSIIPLPTKDEYLAMLPVAP